ncbi:hypothetical protein F183_A06140 [Bryobacterales bacterium F-183]|nr:hypothetical protein F183_A06140 [Bryobacterales bacterium F-183]
MLPEPYTPVYDSQLACWTLRSYCDVRAAFEDRRFTIAPSPVDEELHTLGLRRAMAGFDLDAWKRSLAGLPFVTGATELLEEVAEPWCHAAALSLVGLSADARLLALARAAFAYGARPWDSTLADSSVQLASLLPPVLGPVTTQAFVAVSQSLTAFLATAWAMLLQQGLREAPVEELLRVAGPSQVQFRWFQGVKVGLCVGAANRDVARFGADADLIDPGRDARGHLAFGYGAHACLGAALTRTAAAVAMPFFAEHYGGAKLVEVRMPEEPVAVRKPLAVRIA